jgi:hypothetical protein
MLSYNKVQAELIQIFVVLLARNKPPKLPSDPTLEISIVSPKQFYKSNPSQTIHHPNEVIKVRHGQLMWRLQSALRTVTHSTVEMEEQEAHYL